MNTYQLENESQMTNIAERYKELLKQVYRFCYANYYVLFSAELRYHTYEGAPLPPSSYVLLKQFGYSLNHNLTKADKFHDYCSILFSAVHVCILDHVGRYHANFFHFFASVFLFIIFLCIYIL